MRNKAMAEEEKPKTAENGTIAAAVTDEEAAEAEKKAKAAEQESEAGEEKAQGEYTEKAKPEASPIEKAPLKDEQDRKSK